MTEREMQTVFGKYIRANPPNQSEVYELKITKEKSLSFDSLKEHQIKALMEAENGFLYHKLTDQPFIPDLKFRFTSKKPFDCFALVKVKAFVVIWFYHSRQKKVFIKIGIKDFLKEMAESERKSITESRAFEIGFPFVVDNYES